MIHVVESVKADIMRMDNDQLIEIARAVNLRRTYLTKQTIRAVVVGDIVSFQHNGGTISGKVTNVGRKNLKIRTGNQLWRVSANMVTPLHIGG